MNLIFPIFYLEQHDLQPFITDQPTIVMIQGNFCGYCTAFKPLYQKIANRLSGQIRFATIQIDGNRPGEQVFKTPDFLTQVLGFKIPGVPTIVKFNNGHVVSVYKGDINNEAQFEQWVAEAH